MEVKVGDCHLPLVSVIVPVYNASPVLREALESVTKQTYAGWLEVVLWDDCSVDDSVEIAKAWIASLGTTAATTRRIAAVLGSSAENRGPGCSRNSAVKLSSGELLVHLDADDVMHPERISKQVALYMSLPREEKDIHLIGTNFTRLPLDSTAYYTTWLNQLSQKDLSLQSFRECTIICPSWCYSRVLFDRIALHRAQPNGGAFVEMSQQVLQEWKISRVPEDLLFFLHHVLLEGKLIKVPEALVTYRYSPGGWTLGSKKQDLQRVRARYLEEMVLTKQKAFQIWGYGKDGRSFLKMLSTPVQRRLVRFLDVDENKLKNSPYYSRETGHYIPVVHYRDKVDCAIIIICVASKRAGGESGGELERNIASLNLEEGIDYLHFC